MRLLLFLGWLAVSSAFAQDVARMHALVESSAKDNRFMGSVLVVRDGRTVFEESVGWANVEWKLAFTPHTKFRIGSVTKQFTAAAILKLQEMGRLSVDDELGKFVPSAPETWRKVTVRQLLTHTGGVPSVTDQPGYGKWKLSPMTPAEVMAQLADKPLEFTPGERFNYSNTGYILLGWIVELASGQSYEAFLREHIFDPLGMKDSGVDSNASLIPERAAGYMRSDATLTNAPYIDMHVPGGAGALYSTPADLVRWTEGVFGGKLLTPESLRAMTTPVKNGYAFGVGVVDEPGKRVIAHNGGIEGFNAYLAYYPDTKVTVVVLANVLGSPFDDMGRKLGELMAGKSVTLMAERKQVSVSRDVLKRYVGVYELHHGFTNTIRLAEAGLTTQLSGQAALPLFPESERRFFLKVVDAQVEFEVDGQGKVVALTQFQGGRTMRATRITDTVVERTAVAIPKEILAPLVGTYRLAPNFAITVTLEGDQLQAQATGQPKFPVYPESATKYFYKVVDAQLEFSKDAAGKPTLTLHQGGRDMTGPQE